MSSPEQSTSTSLQPAVELLERAVSYARGTLAHVSPQALHNPTPCLAWDLGQLLAHMDDALDAFVQARGGTLALTGPAATRQGLDIHVVERIRAKACALLGAWAGDATAPEFVLVGKHRLGTRMLVHAGALEITVHGWDVGQAVGHPSLLPEDLAHSLLPIARTLVTPADRPSRFAAEIQPVPQDSGAQRLLGYLGRIA